MYTSLDISMTEMLSIFASTSSTFVTLQAEQANMLPSEISRKRKILLIPQTAGRRC